jgi:predicted Zn-dependent protease
MKTLLQKKKRKSWRILLFVFVCLFIVACEEASQKNDELLLQNQRDAAELQRLKNVIGTRLISRSDFDSLKKLREKYPDAIEVRKTLQSALIIRQDWIALERLLTEIPADQQTELDKTELTKTYIKLGKGNDAIQTVVPLADAKPDNVDLNGLAGQAFFLTGKNEEAAKYIDRVWDKLVEEKRVDEMAVRGLIYFYQGNNQKALEVLQQANKLNAQHIPTINALVRVYAAMGDQKQANNFRVQAEKIVHDITADEAKKAKLVERANEIQKAWNEKRYEDVIRIAQEMIPDADNANKAVLYEYLAQSYQALGKTAEAKAAMDEAAKLKKQ